MGTEKTPGGNRGHTLKAEGQEMSRLEYGIETVDIGFTGTIGRFSGMPGDSQRRVAISKRTHTETLNFATHLWGRATGRGAPYSIYLGKKPEGVTMIRINPTSQKRIYRATISANLTHLFTGDRELTSGSLNLAETTQAFERLVCYVDSFFPEVNPHEHLEVKRADVSTTFTQPDSIAWIQKSQRYLADNNVNRGKKEIRTYNSLTNCGLSYGSANTNTVIYSKQLEATRTDKRVIQDAIRIEHKAKGLRTPVGSWLDTYVQGVNQIEAIMVELDEAYREQSYAGGVVDMLRDALEVGLINREKFHQLVSVELSVIMFGPGQAADHLGYSTRWLRELRREMDTLQTQLAPQIRQQDSIKREFVAATDLGATEVTNG